VTDVRAKPLLSMTTNLFKSRAVVHLDGDGELVLHGNGWGDGFTIRDADGRYVARTSSEPPSPGAARHPDDMVLVEIPGVLHLAEIISVVHIWRMVKKAAIVSSAAASSSVAGGV